MKKIDNVQQMQVERIRLQQKKLNLELEIESDFKEIKSSLSPAKLIPGIASKFLINKNHGILNDSIGLLVDVVIRKVLFRNAGFITKLIMPMLARTVTSNVVADNKDKIFSWIGDLLSKSKKKKNGVIYDHSTAEQDY